MMQRDQFLYLCQESKAGRDAFVSNVENGEHGQVQECRLEQMIVKTSGGDHCCWDYHDCEEIHRTKGEFPWR